MDVRSFTSEGAHFDGIHTSANFYANSNKIELESYFLKESIGANFLFLM